MCCVGEVGGLQDVLSFMVNHTDWMIKMLKIVKIQTFVWELVPWKTGMKNKGFCHDEEDEGLVTSQILVSILWH